MNNPIVDDGKGFIEFIDDIVPAKEAIDAGVMTFRIIGINPVTGNRIAEALITKLGQEIISRQFPISERNIDGGLQ